MDSLKYKRTDILNKLKTNRDKHAKDYETALTDFKDIVIVELTQALADAKSGKGYKTHLTVSKPSQYLKQYDRAIAMFSMSSQDEIELSEHEFTQYVLDNWSWSDSFGTTVSGYASHKANLMSSR